jgi:hypothetical protein
MLTQLYFRGRVLVVFAIFTVLGAAALCQNTATQVVRTVTTNAQGRYAAPELIVGASADE